MTNQRYVKCNEHLGKGDINLIEDTIDLLLVDNSLYTPNVNTDEFLEDIPESSRLFQSSGGLQNKSISDGVFDSDDFLCEDISSGTVDNIILYKNTGDESTSILICIINDATNLPISPGTSGLKIKWSNGPNKIFTI